MKEKKNKFATINLEIKGVNGNRSVNDRMEKDDEKKTPESTLFGVYLDLYSLVL